MPGRNHRWSWSTAYLLIGAALIAAVGALEIADRIRLKGATAQEFKRAPSTRTLPRSKSNIKLLHPPKGPAPLSPQQLPAPTTEVTVIDGDTVRSGGAVHDLVGFDAPEVDGKCERERDLAARATSRLRELVAAGNARLRRVPCACAPGTEGTAQCNFGRLCGALAVGGREVSGIMISEGLAEPYLCSGTSCPPRPNWCR